MKMGALRRKRKERLLRGSTGRKTFLPAEISEEGVKTANERVDIWTLQPLIAIRRRASVMAHPRRPTLLISGIQLSSLVVSTIHVKLGRLPLTNLWGSMAGS